MWVLHTSNIKVQKFLEFKKKSLIWARFRNRNIHYYTYIIERRIRQEEESSRQRKEMARPEENVRH